MKKRRRWLAILLSIVIAVVALGFTKDFFDYVYVSYDLTVAGEIQADEMSVRSSSPFSLTTSGHGMRMDGPIIIDSMTFTYTDPLTITGVLTDVRLLYYQE
jgi:hypothetical protein